MHIVLLHTAHMGPVPETIQVIQEFGWETILAENGTLLASGTSMYLSGPLEEFAKWLGPVPDIWVSNNPTLGKWYVVHVKRGLLTPEAAEPVKEPFKEPKA